MTIICAIDVLLDVAFEAIASQEGVLICLLNSAIFPPSGPHCVT